MRLKLENFESRKNIPANCGLSAKRLLGFFIAAVAFSLPIICFTGTIAHAWPLRGDSALRGAWGVNFNSWSTMPTGTNYGEFCLGNSASSSGGCQKRMGIHGDDEAVVGLVAWKLNENGGYFCVTQFQCEGKSTSWTWNLAPQNGQPCFWLCKDGYTGSNCSTAVNQSEYSLSTGNPACSKVSISRSDFSSNNVKVSGNTGLNQENNIDLLHSRYDGGKEMDVMVGVSKWLSNKKGVVASPFLFWCRNRANSNQMDINFYTQHAQHTLCLPGYTGANCERCKATNMCSGYNISQFDPAKHTMVESGNCGEFRCSEPNKGFKSASEKNTCVECGDRGGILKDGTCKSCPVGENFSESKNDCAQATAYVKSDMTYGKGKDSGVKFEEQCWALAEPAQYSSCVKGTIIKVGQLSSLMLATGLPVSILPTVSSSFKTISPISSNAVPISTSFKNALASPLLQ